MNLDNIKSKIQIGSLIRSANYNSNEENTDETEMTVDEKKGTTSYFVELFWFICQNKSRYDNELELLTMSYNVTHGNVRFNGYLKAFDCYRNGALFINPKKITTNFAIYPITVNIKNSIGQEYIYRFDKLQTQMLYMACENVLNNGTIMSAFARKN